MNKSALVRKWVAVLSVGWSVATFGCGETDGKSSTETNWLKTCSTRDECGALDCVCGVCTQACQAVGDCTRAQQATRCGLPDDPSMCQSGELSICLPDSELAGAGGLGSSDVSGGGGATAGIDEPTVCSSDAECGEREYCDFMDDSCGANGAIGSCWPFPLECSPASYFCTCDRQVTNCDVSDHSRAGGCELAPNQIACGDKVCSADTQICVELDVENPTEAEAPRFPMYECWEQVATLGCEGQAISCECLSAAAVCNSISTGAVALSCEAPGDGEVKVSCLN